MHHCWVKWDKYQTYFVFGLGQNDGVSDATGCDSVEFDVEFEEDDAVVVVYGDRKDLANGKALCTLEGTVYLF